MAVVRDFWAKVKFTDADGEHAAGTLVRVPYGSDAEIAAAQSMLSYGVLTEQVPPVSLQPNDEAPVVAEQPEEPAPVVLTPNDENTTSAEEAPIEEVSAPDEPAVDAPVPQKKAARKKR